MPGTWDERPERAFIPILNKRFLLFRVHFQFTHALRLLQRHCSSNAVIRWWLHRSKTAKPEMLITQLDRKIRRGSNRPERGLLNCIAYVKSVHLWRDGSRRRRGSYVLQKRRSQGASGTWFEVAERLQAKLSPAAKLLTDLTLRQLLKMPSS